MTLMDIRICWRHEEVVEEEARVDQEIKIERERGNDMIDMRERVTLMNVRACVGGMRRWLRRRQ